MAKPMSPAQIAAIAKTTLINSITMPSYRETAAFIAARGVQRSAPRDSPRPARSRLHHRHHRVGFLVVDDIGNRQDHHDIAFVLPPVLEAIGLASDFSRLVQD